MLAIIALAISYVPNKVTPGISAPLGFFDPLKFSSKVSESKFKFFQEAEIKHGRVAMLASVGFPLAEQYHPLWGGDVDVPSYIAFQATPLQTMWLDVVLFIAIIEVFSVFTFKDPFETKELWSIKDSHDPGNLGFDPFKLKPKDETLLVEMKTREINNGRLAMGAIAVMVMQEIITGSKIF